jgi:hypothetical protein
MVAVVLTLLCFVAVVVGVAFVTEPWGRAVAAAAVIGWLVLEARDRAGDP